jgi:hypothetical protein
MGAGKIYISNDHELVLMGLRRSDTKEFLAATSVEGRLLASEGGAEISGQSWPLTMDYVDPTPDTVGGDSSGYTIVSDVEKFDITVTVGANVSLALAAGRLVRVLHQTEVYRMLLPASGAPGETISLHVEPAFWERRKPSSVKARDGEPIEMVDGVYSGTLEDTLAIADGETYFAEVKADDSGVDKQQTFNVEVQASHRGAN